MSELGYIFRQARSDATGFSATVGSGERFAGSEAGGAGADIDIKLLFFFDFFFFHF